LRGANAGDEREFEVVYPEDTNDKRLAGHTFVYTVKIQAIKQKNLPELNDAFAKELGEFSDLEHVRKQIRENMEAERKHTAEREAKDKLVAELVKRNDFEVPESLIDRQIDLRLERGLELNHELDALARQSKQTSEAVRARLTQDGGLDRIRNRIRSEKTLEFLYHQSA
jgi:trigger factor